MPDDYYALLGVTADANRVELRRAWRRLALRWHPDRAGSSATRLFQHLSAAYAVLSDPAQRAAYDRRRGTGAQPAPRASGDVPPAPTAAGRRRAPGQLLSRLSGPLNALLACGVARREAPDVIELFLRPGEAAEGGMITISMWVPIRCSACDGRAPSCAKCDGRGRNDALFSAWLAVQPGISDGCILTPTVPLPGMIRPVRFRITVRGSR